MSENKAVEIKANMSVFITCLDNIKQINEIVKSGKLTERQMEIIVLSINRVLNFINADNSNTEPPISKLELD